MGEWTRSVQKFNSGPRFAHASCAVGRTIYVFGGQKKGYLNDLWAWECASDEWISYSPAGKAPAPRVQHTAVFTGKEMLVFGGYVENVAEENDLHALDVLNPERESLKWTQPQVSGERPPKRYGHTTTMVGTRMVLIAGQNSSQQLSDVWVLDTPTYAWSHLDVSGDIFIPRTLHSASYVPGVGIVVLGGFNRKTRNLCQALVLELDNFKGGGSSFKGGGGGGALAAKWSNCAAPDPHKVFKGRAQHRAVVQASHLIVFGGFDGERALHDLVVFDCETRVFRPAEQRASPPEPRCRHTLELVGSELYCMLGYKGETAVGPDVFSLQVGSDKEKIAKILGSGAAQEGDVDRGQSDNEAEGGEAGERHEDEGGE